MHTRLRILARIAGNAWLSALVAGLTAGCGGTTFIYPHTMFVGDSITQLWNTSSSGQEQTFVLNNWEDKGVSGSSSGAIEEVLQTDLTAEMRCIHIIAGTNDVYPGWQLSNTSHNIETMVAFAKHNHAIVILGTIPPWGPGSLAEDADPSPDRFTRIRELNEWIMRYGQEQGIPVIDYHGALVDANGKNYASGLSTDGVHPNAAGYAVMTPLAEQVITSLLSRAKP